MNENINLCEILKGHEGETFYSPIYGNCKFVRCHSKCNDYPIEVIPIECKTISKYFTDNGKYSNSYSGECMLFPSKDQRDWNKWIEEQNIKTPKTWSELIKDYNTPDLYVNINNDGTDICCGSSPIEKSALAFFKIHQLIETGYGGNVSNEEWKDDEWKYVIGCYSDTKEFKIVNTYHYKSLIAFHTKLQAEEFLSYPENVQLLKDYFQIN